MSNQIILSTLEDIEKLELREETLLSNHPSFYHWHKVIDDLATKLAKDRALEKRDYQVKYAAMGCIRDCNLFAHAVGVGKTITTAYIIHALYSPVFNLPYGSRERVHILVPNNLTPMRWLEDLSRFPHLSDQVAWCSTPTQLFTAIKDKNILIYTYDMLKRKWEDSKVVDELILKYAPSMIVADEVHNLGNRNTERWFVASKLRRSARRVLGLTGTLGEGKLSTVDTLCSFIYGPNWPYGSTYLSTKFESKTRVSTHYIRGEIDAGEQNARYLEHLDVLKAPHYYEIARRYVHRVTLREPEVRPFIKLPETERHVHIVEPKPWHKKMYENTIEMYSDSIKQLVTGELDEESAMMVAFSTVSALIEQCNYPRISPRRDEVTSKQEILLELIDNYSKAVIFCNRVRSAGVLEQLAIERWGKKSVVRVYATDEMKDKRTMSLEQRWREVNKFQADPKVKVGIFSVKLASESIDLTAADAVFFYCLPWRSLSILQALGRVLRPGNVNPNIDQHFIAHKGFIDQHQLTLLDQKLKNSNWLMDFEGNAGLSKTIDPIKALYLMMLDYDDEVAE